MSATLHICRPPTMWERAIFVCPCCKKRGRIVGMVQPWYVTTWTCCNCGDSWAGGELLGRPLVKGWRAKAITNARQRWAEGAARRAVSSWLTEELAS